MSASSDIRRHLLGTTAAVVVAVALAGAPLPAHADFAAGVKAFERGDFRKAYEEWLPLARGGDPAAQRNIGQLYRQGRGVPQSDEVAANWYRLAAQHGHAAAQANLGVMYLQGQGVAKDPAEAARWFEKAAEQGHAIAQYNLALMYEQGLGVERNRNRAMGWYQRAAEGGHERAAERVAQFLNDKVAPAAGDAARVAEAAPPPRPPTRAVETSRSHLYLPPEFTGRGERDAPAVAAAPPMPAAPQAVARATDKREAAPPAVPVQPVEVAKLEPARPAAPTGDRLTQALGNTTPPAFLGGTPTAQMAVRPQPDLAPRNAAQPAPLPSSKPAAPQAAALRPTQEAAPPRAASPALAAVTPPAAIAPPPAPAVLAPPPAPAAIAPPLAPAARTVSPAPARPTAAPMPRPVEAAVPAPVPSPVQTAAIIVPVAPFLVEEARREREGLAPAHIVVPVSPLLAAEAAADRARLAALAVPAPARPIPAPLPEPKAVPAFLQREAQREEQRLAALAVPQQPARLPQRPSPVAEPTPALLRDSKAVPGLLQREAEADGRGAVGTPVVRPAPVLLAREAALDADRLRGSATATVQQTVTATAAPAPRPADEPAPAAVQPEPTKAAVQPEPTKAAVQPEPTKAAAQPELTKAAAQPELTKAAVQPEPTKAAAQPEPTKAAERPESAGAVAPPAPAKVAAQPEPAKSAALPAPANDSTPPVVATTPEPARVAVEPDDTLRRAVEAKREEEITAGLNRLALRDDEAAPAPDFLRREAREEELVQSATEPPTGLAPRVTLPSLPTFLRQGTVPRAAATPLDRIPVPDLLKSEAAREMAHAPVTEVPDFLAREAQSGNRAVRPRAVLPDTLVREAQAERERQVAEAHRNATGPDSQAPGFLRQRGTPDIPGFNPDAARRAVDIGVVAYIARDYKKAYEFWMPVARTGQADAQFFVGGLFLDGHGVPRDLVEAHVWFTRAATQGHLRAEESLGTLRKIMTDAQLREARGRLARGQNVL